MSQTMNQMLALIDNVISGGAPARNDERLPAIYYPEHTIMDLSNAHLDGLVLSIDLDQQEQARDQRARDWLASLPAAQA